MEKFGIFWKFVLAIKYKKDNCESKLVALKNKICLLISTFNNSELASADHICFSREWNLCHIERYNYSYSVAYSHILNEIACIYSYGSVYFWALTIHTNIRVYGTACIHRQLGRAHKGLRYYVQGTVTKLLPRLQYHYIYILIS